MKSEIQHNFSELGLSYDFRTKNLYERKRIRKFKNPNIFDRNQSGFERQLGSDYFVWTDDCEAFYKNPIDWNNVFPTTNAIGYKSTPIQADGNYLRISDHDESSTEESKTRYPQGIYSETSGYIVPQYYFTKPIPAELFEIKTSYVDALKRFDIEEEQKISPTKYTEISKYRDALHHQIERQARAVNELNQEIANVFKIYFYELERAVVLTKMKAQDNSTIKRIQEDWEFFRIGIKDFYQSILFEYDPYLIDRSLSGYSSYFSKSESTDALAADLLRTDEKLHFHIEESTYIPRDILDKILDGYYALMMSKEPIIMMASIIISKIRPLESILEDHCRDMLLKTTVEYTDYEAKQGPHTHSPHSEWIIKTFEEQLKIQPSQNKAAKETIALYRDEFKLIISKAQIYRICGIY